MTDWTGLSNKCIQAMFAINKYGPCSLVELEFLTGNIGNDARNIVQCLVQSKTAKVSRMSGKDAITLTGRGLQVLYYHDFLQRSVRSIYDNKLMTFRKLSVKQRITSLEEYRYACSQTTS